MGAASQERGAIALGEAVQGLGVNTRVLMIGAHPDDEDTNLIAWLSRGRHVSTAYLSLTRGDGGQNIIGNELGEALGVLRTEELLAARRIDGALQYFTRAYDFGFSKDTSDTFAHWPRDTILGDVVRVVRAFQPHVIVAVFSGTTRDGHGQHQVSGILAREAYDVAGDTARFAARTHGAPWTPLKFYRAARGNAQAGTLGMNVGEYSPLRGESYGEIAGRSRSQHKSQAFGSLERKGPIMNFVRREATRVNADTPAQRERSLFDGIDTTWARFRSRVATASARAALDSLPVAFNAVRQAYDPFEPAALIEPLARLRELIYAICRPGYPGECYRYDTLRRHSTVVTRPDLYESTLEALRRTDSALVLASGVVIDAVAREEWPADGRERVIVTLVNRGQDTIFVRPGVVSVTGHEGNDVRLIRALPPSGTIVDTLVSVPGMLLTTPLWMSLGARTPPGGWFRGLHDTRPENRRPVYPVVSYMAFAGSPDPRSPRSVLLSLREPVVRRYVDPVDGEIRRPVAFVPRVTLTLEEPHQFARAGEPMERDVRVRVHLAGDDSLEVRVHASGELAVDSATRIVRLTPSAPTRELRYRLSMRAPYGARTVRFLAEADSQFYHRGYQLIDYEHIRPQRVYRRAELRIDGIDVRVPNGLRVAYVPGVADNVAPVLTQLGIPVTVIPASEIGQADLSGFTTIVIGPRAYDANPELINANPRLFDFARNGGTLVVQYGQYEMTRPGMMPYPVTIARPHNRVTHENAPVTIIDAAAVELRAPNRIWQADFDGWVQERSLYMPRSFDARYRPLLTMGDPGEEPNSGAVLVAPLGRGTYVYTSLAFFRQLPAGVPGAARLFVNLLAAGQPAAGGMP